MRKFILTVFLIWTLNFSYSQIKPNEKLVYAASYNITVFDHRAGADAEYGTVCLIACDIIFDLGIETAIIGYSGHRAEKRIVPNPRLKNIK